MEERLSGQESLSIYIHIPFCVRKCLYCDFLSAPADRQFKERYAEALCHEMILASPEYQHFQVVSVFVGGGTPSVLDVSGMKAIFATLRKSFRLTSDCEITIEVNPGTVTGDKLRAYQEMGINRLSIGLQSANDEELKALGRIHDYQTFEETYTLAVREGFTNINIDLMSAIPLQTLASYERTLQTVLGLTPPPAHISSYSLIVEEGTPFYEHTPALPDEEEERAMYKITDAILKKAGYHRYEISNYAKAGAECRHNQVYWQRGNYLGFGIGSASLVHNVRWKNLSDITSYVNLLRCGEKTVRTIPAENDVRQTKDNTQEPVRYSLQELREEVTVLSVKEQMEEFMFLGLRMMRGVYEEDFYRQFGKRFDEVYPGVIEKHVRLGLLVAQSGAQGASVRQTPGEQAQTDPAYRGAETHFLHLYLTEKGIDVSNQVFVDFMF